MYSGGDIYVGGLIGRREHQAVDEHFFSGINYFVASGGTNGIGDGTCPASVCVQATGSNASERSAWLEDSIDETLDTGLNWDAALDADANAIWGNLNAAGFPCLKNMPEGATACN